MNQSITVRTGNKPVEMIFGQTKMTNSFLETENFVPLHHSIQNKEMEIKSQTIKLTEMAKEAKETLESLKYERNNKINETRIVKSFKENDIVFMIDRYSVLGSTRPLKTKFHPSPFIVVKPYHTTVLVKQIADSFKTLVSMEDLKKFKKEDKIFDSVPEEVRKILIQTEENLLNDDISLLTKIDPLPLIEFDPIYEEVSEIENFGEKREGGIQAPKLEAIVEKVDSDTDSEDEEDVKKLRSGRRVKFESSL